MNQNTVSVVVTVEIGAPKKYQFKVNRDSTFGSFLFQVRKHLESQKVELNAEDALFAFVGSQVMVPCSQTMNQLLHEYGIEKDKKRILHVRVMKEATFG